MGVEPTVLTNFCTPLSGVLPCEGESDFQSCRTESDNLQSVFGSTRYHNPVASWHFEKGYLSCIQALAVRDPESLLPDQ